MTAVLLLVLFCGCSQLSETKKVATCSFRPVEETELPSKLFSDNFDNNSLRQATERSIAYLGNQDPKRKITVCDRPYTIKQQLESLQLFNDIIQSTPAQELYPKIYDKFDVCQAQNSSHADNILVTGYFQPRFRGSLKRQPPFIYPIYAPPNNLVSGLKYNSDSKPTTVVGRIEQGRLLPYWSRSEIENKDLLHGNEIIYLADQVDVFTLHVQGSGLVELGSGKIIQVRYATSNGRPYRSIGKLLADEGKIPLQDVTMPKIRQYLNEHLDDQQRILHYNKRYIFFSIKDENAAEPIGAMGEPLIPGRSVALDNSCFDQGGIFFLQSQPPKLQNSTTQVWIPTSRFVLHHDTGAAIKGTGRLDLYLGSGNSAGVKAGSLKHPARLYVLIKKM